MPIEIVYVSARDAYVYPTSACQVEPVVFYHSSEYDVTGKAPVYSSVVIGDQFKVMLVLLVPASSTGLFMNVGGV